MNDTSFDVPADKLARFTDCIAGDQVYDAIGGQWSTPARFESGGGGLVSTIDDYHTFTRMLLGKGAANDVRILGRKTVEYMTLNHLPGNKDLAAMGQPIFSETPYDGIGFGLGFSVVKEAVKEKTLSSAGEFAWGGAASTAFWVDPAEELTAMFFTQLLPSSTHPIRQQLRQLVYQALVA